MHPDGVRGFGHQDPGCRLLLVETKDIMKTSLWVVVAAVGFGIMLAAYTMRARPDLHSPWASGLIAIGPEVRADVAKTGGLTPVRLRLLPAVDRTELILKVIRQAAQEKAIGLEKQLRPKLIVLALDRAGIDSGSLQSGRLAEAGRDEVIAGPRAPWNDQLKVGDRVLKVVGSLKPDAIVFRGSYLLPPSEAANSLLPEGDPSVHSATLVQTTPEQIQDGHFLQQLQQDLPPPKYTYLMPVERLELAAYCYYLAGLAAFLLGGSGALIGLFRGLAARARRSSHTGGDGDVNEHDESKAGNRRPSWWASPLLEMEQRPRLVWGVHLVYFGLVIFGCVLIYNMPDVQALLLSAVGEAFAAPRGPIAAAGKAYLSGSIPRAAAVTFLVNFFLGSLLVLTLPSVILPGSGVFMAALRSMMWGLLLAPTIKPLAHAMLPHSGTLLLEGEGYILATLFGLLIPIHIVQSSLGGNPLSRFGRVLWLNVKANLWVALVLAVAACYEATEVILMNR
jgi:hypothetical protein